MQLLVLASVHFFVDMFASILPPILPAIRTEFVLSLFWGGVILVVLTLTSNGVQILTGHMRAEKTSPLFMYIGMILAVAICLLATIPAQGIAFPALIVLAVVSGSGIAIAHPEGLRGIHQLDKIPPAISTAVFMTGGFVGYAGGGAVSAYLVSRFGLQGLYYMMFCPLIGIVLVAVMKIRLAVEPKPNDADPPPTASQLNFWLILVMAVPAAVSTTIVAWLLPTRLNELGFELTFGGFSTMMFGMGGAAGSFVWGYIGHKKGELLCSIIALVLVIPFLAAYLILIENPRALYLLFATGFFAFSAYILMVTLARHSTGPILGRRMAFMLGGTWAIATLFFLCLLPVAEYCGTKYILNLSPVGYFLSVAIGIYIMRKNPRARGPISNHLAGISSPVG